MFKSKRTQLVARLVLGSIFIYASIDKISYPENFIKIVQNYNILPEFLIIIIAYILPWIELILGIFLIAGFFIRETALVLSSLILVFIIAISIKALNGTIDDCGCFNKLSILSSSNIVFLILRDVLFLLFGIILILPGGNLEKLNNIHIKRK